MAAILGIGVATVDTIFTVERFPIENDKCRASALRVRRGGNATNTLVVLAQLGHQATWGGVLADDPSSAPIVADLKSYGVDMTRCRRLTNLRAPTSFILQTEHSSTRTVVHYRDLPEFVLDDFKRIDLTGFDWLHFEGRNCLETRRMLEFTHATRTPTTRLSLEVERAREPIDDLFVFCDVVMFSQGFAEQRGFRDPLAFLNAQSAAMPDKILTCTWGSVGAAACGPDSSPVLQHATIPAKIVETIGAGDTFNAGLIDALVRDQPVRTALSAATRLAGLKCGINEFHLEIPP